MMVVKTSQMVTSIINTGKKLAGVEVEEEPPAKRARGKRKGQGFGKGDA